MNTVICPHCSSEKINKYGKYNENQRYKCKECNKTFTEITHTIMHCSKKFKEQVKEFTKLMYKNKTLREIAAELKITLVTAFFWRHKIIGILSESNKNNLLKGVVEGIDYITKENFKGQRNIKTEEREKIQIIVPFDEYRRSNPKITSIGTPKIMIIRHDIKSILAKESVLEINYNRYMVLVSKEHNKGKVYISRDDFRKDMIFSKIKKWMKKFRGVASKYVEIYLGWFILDYKMDKVSLWKYEDI